MTSTWRLDRARPDDLAAVLALDEACFDAPWPADAWRAELERPFAAVTLAREGAQVQGLACDWCVAGQAHLLRLATHPRVRGRGLARAMLADVLARAAAAGCEDILLEVGARNAAARGLYAAHGFVEIARRAGYYRSPPDDAVVMRRPLP